jgi:hypothetical protein
MAGKDFQKSMEAGAKPFEEVYKKQAEAIEQIEKNVDGKSATILTLLLSKLKHNPLADHTRPKDIPLHAPDCG